MKKRFFILLLFPCMIFAQQEPLQEVCSKGTLVKTLYAYKRIKDAKKYDSDSIKRGIQVLQVGCMMVEHPIAKVVGAVLELASVGIDVCEMFLGADLPEQVVQEMQYHDIFIPERFYFEVMRKKLIDLKKEFEDIKHVVCGSYDFVSHEIFFEPFAITIAQEASLSQLEKKYLRIVREKELYDLQQNILNVQYQIAWHISELVCARSEALDTVKKVLGFVSEARSAIKNSLSGATKDQLIDLYNKERYLEKMLRVYFDAHAKILLLIKFFKKSTHENVLQQTSNVMDVLAHVEEEILVCDVMFRDEDCI